MWKTEMLAERDGINVWKAENIDDQGFPFLIVKLNSTSRRLLEYFLRLAKKAVIIIITL